MLEGQRSLLVMYGVCGAIENWTWTNNYVWRTQVRLDANLIEKLLLMDVIKKSINQIYYLLLAILTDSFVATSSAYWLEFGMSSVDVAQPSVVVVGNVAVPSEDYSIQPSDDVTSHWASLTNDVQVSN